jgi:hypothetical protein
MNDKLKIIVTVICLSFTCFLIQCQACQKKDPMTKKILPNQVTHTISCGFPFPYFDINTLNTADNNFYYDIDSPYKIGVSVTINIIASIAIFFFVLFISSRKLIKLNRLLLITGALIILFDMCLLVPYYPDFINTILVYLYVYPVMLISTLFELVKIELSDYSIPSRIYLILLIIFIYPFSVFILFVKNYIIIKFDR